MDEKDILDILPTEFPIGLGGCRTDGTSFSPCEYNVTIFDGKNSGDEVIVQNGDSVKVSHGLLDDFDSDVLIHYTHMKILHDPRWELQALLAKVKQRRENIFFDYAKNCLFSSIFCCTRSNDGIDSDVFAPCWQKSALIYLANSILALHLQRPSPSHALEKLRSLAKNSITDKISVISDTIGIERATVSSLDRMCKSTVGFSQKTEQNQHCIIIQAKHDYFVKNSMLADCYFYLTWINHNNFILLKNSIHRNPDLIYILKTAFDLENDLEKLRQNNELVQKTCNEILSNMNS